MKGWTWNTSLVSSLNDGGDYTLIQTRFGSENASPCRDPHLADEWQYRLAACGAAHRMQPVLGHPDCDQRQLSNLVLPRLHHVNQLPPIEDVRARAAPPRPMLEELVYRLLRSEAPTGVLISRDYDPSLPDVFVDRDQMIQAMLNISRNAVQALGENGRLLLRTRALINATIGASRHRAVASIEFEDNGPGVPPDLADTIFYPLVTGRPGGNGLGLAVAQELVTRHGGLIEFESRPGRTVFTMLIPFEESSDV